MKKRLLFTISACCAIIITKAQHNYADSLVYQAARQHLTDTYLNFLGSEAPLYSGPLFADYRYNIAGGSAYYHSAHAVKGSVWYKGIRYTDIPLLYDVLDNKLIALHPLTNQSFEIIQKNVEAFEIAGHHFIHITVNQFPQKTDGFYELLFQSNKGAVLKQYWKEKREDLSEQQRRFFIDDSYRYYIKNGEHWEKITGKKSLLKIYADQQKEIRLFLKQQGLDFKKQIAETLVKTVAFLSTIPAD